jgi:hypothetical protein
MPSGDKYVLSGDVFDGGRIAGFRQATLVWQYFRAGIGLTPQPLHDQDENLREAFDQQKQNNDEQEFGDHFWHSGLNEQRRYETYGHGPRARAKRGMDGACRFFYSPCATADNLRTKVVLAHAQRNTKNLLRASRQPNCQI